MSDPLLNTPAFAEAVEAARKSPPMDGWERPEVEVVLLAAAPHLERHFRRVLSEELRRDAGEGQTIAAIGLRFAADHLEGQ